MRKILIIAILFSIFGSRFSILCSQNWTTFNTTNSELGNTVLAMVSDQRNNKWFGTDLGLASLKGRTWTDYSMFNEKLKGQYVNCLSVDDRGIIWIGTDDYGVIEFDGSRWTEHKEQMKRLQMKFISEIAIDKNDVKWIGVTLGGLVMYDGNQWEKFTAANSGLLSDFILCVSIDRRNRKWIGTNEGLSLFDGNRWISFTKSNSKLPDNIVPSVLVDKNDVKWIATLGGLARFDGNEWKVFNTSNSPLPCDQINDLAFDPSGALWMATDKGIALFDGVGRWHVYTPNNSKLPNDVMRRIMVDGQGSKWFGSSLMGLVRFSAQPVVGRVVDRNGQPVQGVEVQCGENVVTTDVNGEYYFEVATNANVTVTPNGEGFTFEPAKRTLTTVSGACFVEDFVVTSGGLVAQGASAEHVMVNPFLEQGYITITLESPEAEVEFLNAKGQNVRTIPNYKNGAKINITRMAKGNYTLKIRTTKGEKTLLFNLK
ncbi:MAG: T9SS type A sorting domain-containing protein [Bacteroidales bacterium]|nr:T9SS type A sorting domain-containing protein [Bacteroidales bacterium]